MTQPPGTPPGGTKVLAESKLPIYIETHENINQVVITVTEDKVRLCLMGCLDKLNRRSSWIAPLGLSAALLASVTTATFHDFLGITGNVWKAMHILALVAALVWLLVAYRARRNTPTIDSIVAELKGLQIGMPQAKRGRRS